MSKVENFGQHDYLISEPTNDSFLYERIRVRISFLEKGTQEAYKHEASYNDRKVLDRPAQHDF